MGKLKTFLHSLAERAYIALTGFMSRQGLLLCVNLPNGSTLSIASTYGAAKTMSAITNATEAVATLEASHGVIENDILEITSGWSRLNKRVVRADSVSTNDVTLEDVDTSSTTKYPAGSGTGTVKEITAWTEISQILTAQTDGGEQQFAPYSFLGDDTERRIPTRKSAQGLTLTVADDQTLAHYSVLLAADAAKTERAIRLVLSNSNVLYFNAIVSFNTTPSLNIDEVMALTVTLSFQAEQIRYSV